MFDYSYYCGANVRVTFISNRSGVEYSQSSTNIVGINYSINYNPQPAYGYCSTYYNAVLKGRELAQGTILINSSHTNIFFQEISQPDYFEKFKDSKNNYNIELSTLGGFDIRIEFGSEDRPTNSGVVLRDCYFTSKGKAIQVSADAIVEEYNFFSREIHNYKTLDKKVEEEKKKKAAEAAAKEEQNKEEQKVPTVKKEETSYLNNFFKDLLKQKDIKLETNPDFTEQAVANNDSNHQPFSVNVNKEISLFNPQTKVVAYSAPFYSKSRERKDQVPQKILNARLLNDLLNSIVRYGDQNLSNENLIRDKKALELVLAQNSKINSDPVLKVKQMSSILWSQINNLRSPYEFISDNLDSPNTIQKDHKKLENYIIESGIQKTVNNFFNGNYSNNIGMCDRFFYEDSTQKPENILTNQNEVMNVNDLVFYLDLNLQEYPIATNIYFQEKKNKYKEYYKELWNNTPSFIKG